MIPDYKPMQSEWFHQQFEFLSVSLLSSERARISKSMRQPGDSDATLQEP
jgi:hypothetical protein